MSDRRITRSHTVRGRDATDIRDQLGLILTRLTELENSANVNATCGTEHSVPQLAGIESVQRERDDVAVATSAGTRANAPSSLSSPPGSHVGSSSSGVTTSGLDATDRIIGALSALSKVRSNHFYISNFDPNVNDIDSWCDEVDRACEINGWDDNECLSRISNCLKGDAKSWLQDWVTNDRSWTNFKIEFKPLCTRRIDIASILFDVMCSNSDHYATYADFARRSLLRLNIVKGLSDELKVAIIIRGITDPQVRAAALNSKLSPKDLVDFFSIYLKPKPFNDPVRSVRNINERNLLKRPFDSHNSKAIKCFSCGDVGHTQKSCSKRSNIVLNNKRTYDNVINSSTKETVKISCSFCKKMGHDASKCFSKQRLENNA